MLAFLRKWSNRLQLVRYDSTELGYFFGAALRDAGYRCHGVNATFAAQDAERLSNSKVEMFWNLRSRFERVEVSGPSSECLAELAAISYLIDPKGRTAVEDKASVKSLIGKSPDLAESLALEIGTPDPAPFEYRVAPPDVRQPMGYGPSAKLLASPAAVALIPGAAIVAIAYRREKTIRPSPVLRAVCARFEAPGETPKAVAIFCRWRRAIKLSAGFARNVYSTPILTVFPASAQDGDFRNCLIVLKI